MRYAHDYQPFVYVVILNWNGWRDTVECLESVCRSDHTNYRVIVCDNNSHDGSFEHIKAWADGRLNVWANTEEPLREMSFPPTAKSIPIVEYDRADAESGGDSSDSDSKLILIQTGDNLGFAGGNNVALRYALSRNDFDYVWLLNNDTVVQFNGLTKMIERMSSSPTAGMCGCTLRYYHRPDEVQAYGGARYNKWFAVPHRIDPTYDANGVLNRESVEEQMRYVIGASMLISKRFLQDIGLLSEDYFLCFEELDWATRASGRYSLCYAQESVVYHKDGKSIGHTGDRKRRSLIADFYNISNRLVFTRKYYRWALPTVYIGLMITLSNKARRGEWDRVIMILKLIFSDGGLHQRGPVADIRKLASESCAAKGRL